MERLTSSRIRLRDAHAPTRIGIDTPSNESLRFSLAEQVGILRMRVAQLRVFAVLMLLMGGVAYADDWPMWRFDAGHTAAGAGTLPDRMELSWTRVYSPREQVWDDPLNHDMMPYDRLFEPVVKDGRMFVNFNDADKVVALDVETGEELWSYYTDGPVRFPAVAWQDGVYFCSDDGYLYCVNARDGQLRWKHFGAPTALKVIGNGRMISAWPARGGPVISDGQLYFANSIWPFMGTYIWCLDAATGDVVWVNDSTASQYIKQPHSAPSFAGVAPSGHDGRRRRLPTRTRRSQCPGRLRSENG